MAAPLAKQARGVYRSLLRASNTTFAGDIASQSQFNTVIRQTFSSPTLTSPIKPSNAPPPAESCSQLPKQPSPATLESHPEGQVTQEQYEAKLKHWSDVAKILRENVVQGRRIEEENARRAEAEAEAAREEEEKAATYRLRLTRHTQLGDNTSIRTPPKLESTPFPNRSNEARERRKREREKRIKEREAAQKEGEDGVAV